MSDYKGNLIDKVIELSESNNWRDAVLEWEITDSEIDENINSNCICGHESIKYLFTISNKYNFNNLYPIGSSCIKKFKNKDLSETVSITEGLYKLYKSLLNNEFIKLNSDYFSRSLLKKFYNENVFKANDYNNNDPSNDYNFLRQMFNKRDKDSITANQQKKINYLITYTILPYLKDNLKFK